MLFSSLEFILAFLPVTLLAVWFARRFFGLEAAILVLLGASLLFYGWARPEYVALLISSIIGNFALGRAIAHYQLRSLVALGIVLNLCLLGWYKYIGLFSTTLSAISGGDFTIDGVVLPLAISFFTFLQIAYLADCLKGEAGRYGIADYALFVTFFPHLIAGPLVHHRDLTPQFRMDRFARFDASDISAGLLLFAIGLSKKVLLADSVAPIADAAFDATAAGAAITVAQAWQGVLAYAFQIYFDFSGYSDMAIGLSLFFGVSLPVNFLSPYKSANIALFWRRWHMTLSQFLRDYLYIPLGGNRHGETRRLFNLFMVMLLGGLWHGANWTFMVWGGLHGAYLCVHRVWERSLGRRVRIGPVAGAAMTFAAVCFAWIFFRATSFSSAFLMIECMAGLREGQGNLPDISPAGAAGLMLAPVIAFVLPNAMEIRQRLAGALQVAGASHASGMMALQGALAALSLFVLMGWGSYEFIYFQF